MMKDLKLWQKAGLVAMIVGSLTLGGLTVKNSGLEGKLPSIGMSTAEAKTTEPGGYKEAKNITHALEGKTPYKTVYEEEEGLTYKVEKFAYVNNQHVIRLSRDGKIFAYIIDENMDKKSDCAFVDVDGKKDTDGYQTFEDKYGRGETFPIPNWAK